MLQLSRRPGQVQPQTKKLSKETIHYLARLCRIACTEEQEEALLNDMQKILGYVELLNEIDTEGVDPCNNVSECHTQTPLRRDAVGSTLSRDEFLKNAPQHIGGMIRVPAVLKDKQP